MITVYTKSFCPYCVKAKSLLDSLGAKYQEIDLTDDQETLQKLVEKSGLRTVPQIFVNDKCLGGCDDIYRFHEQGKLLHELEI
ncbi:glutaredoxin 3 [Candidatus Gracilibacteria bacterium]|nr:glutaredoxin 3 [Candidatus Gracilibacteria bacterium]